VVRFFFVEEVRKGGGAAHKTIKRRWDNTMKSQAYWRKLRAVLMAAATLALAPFCQVHPALAQAINDSDILPEITVTGTREAELKTETPANVGSLKGKDLLVLKPAHPAEAIGRISGAHASVTNGEGHKMAIRQPISTSPVYLYLEDGIPTRSTGFFNHNALYEINVPQSGGIEIMKGPGSALQGSDAIGGVINVLTRAPSTDEEIEFSFELGKFGFWRALGSYSDTWGDESARSSVNLTHTDGWRDETDFDRQAATLRWDSSLKNGAALKTIFSVSNIDQQTAGSSRLNRADYKDNPTVNYTPISFRKVKALRLSSEYTMEDEHTLLSLTPYLRWNKMDMMPNWSLSYDPVVYTTGHSSVGLAAKYRLDFAPYRTRLIFGSDIDYSPGSRDEDKINRTKVGNIYTSWEVDKKVYDYDVTFMSLSPYVHGEISPFKDLRISGGLRLDAIRYDYDNHMDVVQTGKYRKAEDNTVNYRNLSPKIGATYSFSRSFNTFISYKHAFRAPSESKLFRSGKAVDTLHLDPVKAVSYEIGIRGQLLEKLNYELSTYKMLKRDDLITYTDAVGDRIITNAGETSHKGVEASLEYKLGNEWKLNGAFSYAEHFYKEWKPSTTVDYSSNEMVSAPRWINNVTIAYTPKFLTGSRLEFEWTDLGKYWMDEANTVSYNGHSLYNVRGSYQVKDNLKVIGRVMNLGGKRYATAASYKTSSGEEFAPGLPRHFYVGLEATF
jgi:outer membrane receptor protein involved in Fe transport